MLPQSILTCSEQHLSYLERLWNAYMHFTFYKNLCKTRRIGQLITTKINKFSSVSKDKSQKMDLLEARGWNSKLFCRASVLRAPSPLQTLHWPFLLTLKCSFSTRCCPSAPPLNPFGCQPCYLCACLLTLNQMLQLYFTLTQLGATSHTLDLSFFFSLFASSELEVQASKGAGSAG